MFITAVVIRNTPKQVSLKGFAWNDQQVPQKYSQYRYKIIFYICMETDTYTMQM